jgi:hypothetical protein
MAAKKGRVGRDPLLLRVCAEIGAGRITEAYIHDPGFTTDGVTWGQQITINPSHATVNTLVHECLHRLFPAWSERTVRAKTTYLCRRLTDAETLAIFAEYEKRKRKRRSPVRLPEDTAR